jgi:hypothetical protein
MSLSRRQFFRRLVKPGQKTPEERQERYDAMDSYVRMHLLPYDFSLSEEQEAELLAAVRADLEQTSDEELFSAILRFKVEEVVDRKVRLWREQDQLKGELNRLNEIRQAGPAYVSLFLSGQGTLAAIDQLKSQLNIEELKTLEIELKARVTDWLATVEDHELLQYDVVSIKDLVFAQLRSWC